MANVLVTFGIVQERFNHVEFDVYIHVEGPVTIDLFCSFIFTLSVMEIQL